jgi:hypothetical protein
MYGTEEKITKSIVARVPKCGSIMSAAQHAPTGDVLKVYRGGAEIRRLNDQRIDYDRGSVPFIAI